MRIARLALRTIPPLYRSAQRAYLRRRTANALRPLAEPDAVAFRPGERVILLDSFWGGSSAVTAARRASEDRAKLVIAVYDMIPVTHPQFCDEYLVREFRRSMTAVLSVSVGIVAISKEAAGDATIFARSKGHDVPAAHFYLGADLGGADQQREPSPDRFPAELWQGNGRVHLMVGTIEPRKGHATVLDAFDLLWRQGRPDKLLIIGKIGWQVEKLMARFASHPQLGRRLFLVHDGDDEMLRIAFARAQASIMASSIEGFGLPLIEALDRELPVIASDIAVFHELAGDAALYFRLDDPGDLAERIVYLESYADEYRERARRFTWLSWAQSAQQLHHAIDVVTAESAGAAEED